PARSRRLPGRRRPSLLLRPLPPSLVAVGTAHGSPARQVRRGLVPQPAQRAVPGGAVRARAGRGRRRARAAAGRGAARFLAREGTARGSDRVTRWGAAAPRTGPRPRGAPLNTKEAKW